MIKTLLLTVSTLVVICNAKAQIILNQVSYAGIVFGLDSVSIVSSSVGLPANIGPVANATWDFSGVLYQNTDTLKNGALPNPYTFEQLVIDTIASPYIFFDNYSYNEISATGYTEVAGYIPDRSYGLTTIIPGAQAADSLKFPAQVDTLTSPHTIIKFPATYGAANSNWSSNYTNSIAYSLTFTVLSISNAPGIYKQLVSEHDSVIGWGKVLLKRPGGGTIPINVLEVKVKYSRTDSFFLNGALPPANLLAAFGALGLTQGHVTNYYEYRYFRSGEITPLIELTFADSTYNKTKIAKTAIHEERLTEGVVTPDAPIKLDIYPNPVTDNVLFVTLPSIDRHFNDLSFRLINYLGQTIAAEDNIDLNGESQFRVKIKPDTPAGLYYLEVNNRGQNVASAVITLTGR